jgi:hypothetical protein
MSIVLETLYMTDTSAMQGMREALGLPILTDSFYWWEKGIKNGVKDNRLIQCHAKLQSVEDGVRWIALRTYVGTIAEDDAQEVSSKID